MANKLFTIRAQDPPSIDLLAGYAAAKLGVSSGVVLAVWDVESAGRFTDANGQPLMRFEPATFDRSSGTFRDFLGSSGRGLRARFDKAYAVDPEGAVRATSWSVGQIMGFHYRTLGYPSAITMVETWSSNPRQAVIDWINFLSLNGLDRALRALDLRAFARGYNGGGNVDAYVRKLRKALSRYGVHDLPVVLSLGDSGPEVKRLQVALGISVDGQFGPNTRDAVLSFQEAQGLAVDGIVGAKTWAALSASMQVTAPQGVGPEKRRDGAAMVEIGGLVGAGSLAHSSLDGLPPDLRPYGFAALSVLLFLLLAAGVYRYTRQD